MNAGSRHQPNRSLFRASGDGGGCRIFGLRTPPTTLEYLQIAGRSRTLLADVYQIAAKCEATNRISFEHTRIYRLFELGTSLGLRTLVLAPNLLVLSAHKEAQLCNSGNKDSSNHLLFINVPLRPNKIDRLPLHQKK